MASELAVEHDAIVARAVIARNRSRGCEAEPSMEGDGSRVRWRSHGRHGGSTAFAGEFEEVLVERPRKPGRAQIWTHADGVDVRGVVTCRRHEANQEPGEVGSRSRHEARVVEVVE